MKKGHIISRLFLLLFLLVVNLLAQGQKLSPGFDSTEFYQLLKVSAQQLDTAYNPDLPYPEKFERVYRSQEMGLDNRWELWLSDDSIAVISIRGTTPSKWSVTEDLFSAMVPAKGSITLADDFNFNYELAQDKDAAVHIGFLIGTAFLGRDMVPKIDSIYHSGVKDFLIVGHSQGGAVAVLLSAYLYSLQDQGKLDSSISFKTYSSAGPKPGNLYFAYSFEHRTQKGWAFNVVNSADWVPESPFSIQTTEDFNASNPFNVADNMLKTLPLGERIVLTRIYKHLEKIPKKANKSYQKYLGEMIGHEISQVLPGFILPEFYNSSNYVRTADQVVLFATQEYYERFPDTEKTIWTHHSFEAYIFLLNGTIIPMDRIKQ